jgi:hypothetical protein
VRVNSPPSVNNPAGGTFRLVQQTVGGQVLVITAVDATGTVTAGARDLSLTGSTEPGAHWHWKVTGTSLAVRRPPRCLRQAAALPAQWHWEGTGALAASDRSSRLSRRRELPDNCEWAAASPYLTETLAHMLAQCAG